MGIGFQVQQYAGRRLTKRLYRAVPILGSVLALATLARAMRRKGAFRGAADTALDFMPIVGGMKQVAEVARGRDFFPDKPQTTRASR